MLHDECVAYQVGEYARLFHWVADGRWWVAMRRVEGNMKESTTLGKTQTFAVRLPFVRPSVRDAGVSGLLSEKGRPCRRLLALGTVKDIPTHNSSLARGFTKQNPKAS